MRYLSEKVLILISAILIDLIFGEYPSVIHPVVYMGKMGKIFEKYYQTKKYGIPSQGPSHTRAYVLGMGALILELFVWLTLTVFVTFYIPEENIQLKILKISLEIFLLKSTFSVKALYQHVQNCQMEDINQLRKNVSMIVSRDTTRLDKPHLYSATIESLAENISDSITGPLFYYAFLGLPGAVVYRVVNTYDALFGYRNEKYEWFGKFPARTDDLLNLVPSRLTALIISLFNLKGAWEYIKKYGAIKINATYPMSAFAGVLGVGFEKIGYYKFHGRLPNIHDIPRALQLYKKVVLILLVVVILLCMVV
ncbi:MAG: adenosylcobinamide-phosphate synthase CbiB [Fervidobacterium sp.]|jgi:adenosylcobinamide-phosphate synthase